MGTSHGCLAASKPKEPALHTFAISLPANSTAVLMEGLRDSAACKWIAGGPYMSSSVPWPFEVAYGHLPRISNREQA